MTGKPKVPRNVSRVLSERDRSAAPATDRAALAGEGGIRLFFEKLAEAAQALGQAGAQAARHDGELPFNLGGKQGRAVFGYAVRMGLDGLRAEPFGDLLPATSGRPHAAAAKPAGAAPRAPIVDVFAELDEIRVVAELPGVAAADAVCTLDGTCLHIETHGAVKYRKTIDLPSPVDPGSLRQSCCNGILDVRLRRTATP